MAITLTGVYDAGNDLVVFTGTTDQVQNADGTNATVTAQGWMSATTNYYPPASYDGSGNLLPGAVPRAMLAAERRAYVLALLRAAETKLIAQHKAQQITPLSW